MYKKKLILELLTQLLETSCQILIHNQQFDMKLVVYEEDNWDSGESY